MQDNQKQAEIFYQKSLAIREKALPKNSLDIANNLINLALIYQKQKRILEAETLYLRAIELTEKKLGINNPKTLEYKSSYEKLVAEKNKNIFENLDKMKGNHAPSMF
jgi:tetratricopeptide (TPR) repeat protein